MTRQGKILFTVEEDERLVRMVSNYPCIYNASSALYKDSHTRDNAFRDVAAYVQRSEEDCRKRWRNIKDTYHKREKRRKISDVPTTKQKKWFLAEKLKFLDNADSKKGCSVEYDEQSSSEWYKSELKYNIECEDQNSSDSEMLDNEIETVDDDKPSLSSLSSSLCHQYKANVSSNRNVEPAGSSFQQLVCENQNQSVQLMGTRRAEIQDLLQNINYSREDEIDVFFKSIAMSVKKLKPELIHEAKLRSLKMVFELENENTII